MMKEEKKIKDTFGNGNHFQVPAGYFDQLADYAMMDSQDFYAQLVAEN